MTLPLLSAAMRKGATMHAQGFNFLEAPRAGDMVTCALGAACHGAGVSVQGLYQEFPALSSLAIHPVTKVASRIESLIVSLNDGHRWTRERIADWLAKEGY